MFIAGNVRQNLATLLYNCLWLLLVNGVAMFTVCIVVWWLKSFCTSVNLIIMRQQLGKWEICFDPSGFVLHCSLVYSQCLFKHCNKTFRGTE